MLDMMLVYDTLQTVLCYYRLCCATLDMMLVWGTLQTVLCYARYDAGVSLQTVLCYARYDAGVGHSPDCAGLH